MRAAVLLVALLPLFSAAEERGARPGGATLGAESAAKAEAPETDTARAARVDALLDATVFPALYDRLLDSLRAQPPGSDDAVAAVWRDLIDLMPWRRTESQWRALFAERLDAAQTADIVAYYRSPSGRAIVDCMTRIEGKVSEPECLGDVSDADSEAYLAFTATPSGETWVELGSDAVRSLMTDTICAGLDRDLPLRRRLAAVCANGATLGFCRMLAPPEAGNEPALDRTMCRSAATLVPEK